MTREYQNTRTSRQVIEDLEHDNEELSEALLRADLQLKAAARVIEQQKEELDELRRDASGQSAEDSRLMDILEETSGVIMPMWEKAGQNSPSYLHVKGSEHRPRTWREAINLIQYT